MTLRFKSDPPPPPDYVGAAKQTAAGDLAAARYATEANRANQINPYGSLTWQNNTTQTFDQEKYDEDYGKWVTNRDKFNAQQVAPVSGGGFWDNPQPDRAPGPAAQYNIAAPDRAQYLRDKDNWTQTVALNETGQKLLDADNKTKLGLAGLQSGLTDRVAASTKAGWDDSLLGDRGTAFSYNQKDENGKPIGPQTTDPSRVGQVTVANNGPFNFGGGGSGQKVDFYDASKVGAVGDVYDPGKHTNDATERILARLNPELGKRRAARETQLANQGITQGSEAWNNAQSSLGMDENDAWTQAGLQGITLGMSQQGQTYGQQMGNRAALTRDQELLGSQQMGVRGQDITASGITAQANAAAAQAALQAQQQKANQEATNARLQLDAQTLAFNQSLAASNQAFNQSNALRAGGIQEQNYFANRDMNQLNAVRTGSQVANPTFGSYAQQQTTKGADILGGVTAGYNADIAANNASNANSSALFGGALKLASGAGFMNF